MKSIAAKFSVAALLLLASCSFTRSVFERGTRDGCMYYRGRVVPSNCIDDMVRAGVDGGYAFSALARCMEGRNREPVSSVVPFITESGVLEPMAACRFDGSASRNHYHFDGTDRLYRRFISCRDGCHMVSDLHKITFEGSLILAEKLIEHRE
jgi:hypothetical protein